MKNLVLVLFSFLIGHAVVAQDSSVPGMEKIMEQRAREMFRIISLDSPDEWKNFIRENYTKALIDKPMQAKVEGGGSTTSSAPKTLEGNIEGKAGMYRMLHGDFGGGQIKTIKTTGEKLDMTVSNEGMNGVFTLRFSKEKPYLIDGLGIEVGDGNR